MRFSNVAIASVASVDAPCRVSSAELEERLSPTMSRLGLPRGLLEGLSGIVARRMWEPGTQPSDAAALAAERAIELAGVDRCLGDADLPPAEEKALRHSLLQRAFETLQHEAGSPQA